MYFNLHNSKLTINQLQQFLIPKPQKFKNQIPTSIPFNLMICPQPLQYRNKSISQLVQELNNLGDTHIVMQPASLIGIIDRQSDYIRRFRSKSMHRDVKQNLGNFVRTHCDQEKDNRGSRVSTNSCNLVNKMNQFFLAQGSQKKYYYNIIANQLEVPTIGSILSMYEQGFNTTIVMEYSKNRFEQFMQKIQPWLTNEQSIHDRYFYASFMQYKSKQALDLLSGKNPKSIPLQQPSLQSQAYYQSTIQQILNPSLSPSHIKLLSILKPSLTSPMLSILLLPPIFLSPSSNSLLLDPSLKLVKSQLSQILNYIRTNPNKKYQNINKLLPKRYPTTTVLAQVLLTGAVVKVVNWVMDGDRERDRERAIGRFQFYEKIGGINNLVKRVQGNQYKGINIVKLKKQQSLHKKYQKPSHNPEFPSQQQIHGLQLQKTQQKSPSQLEFCRSLQRKTHRYSIAQFNPDLNDPLFPDQGTGSGTVPMYPHFPKQLDQSQAITVLKAQHARQVSKYHHTIQTLNKKIQVLMSEKGMSEIFNIHQRQIMMLQLKITELRNDAIKLCSTGDKSQKNDKSDRSKGNNKQIQQYKDIIKRLNQQISTLNKTTPMHKMSLGKIKLLQSQLSQWKQKHNRSQLARKQLQQQLQCCTSRLHLLSASTSTPTPTPQNPIDLPLSQKQHQTLSQIKQLLNSTSISTSISPQIHAQIVRKFMVQLSNVSELREILLECHNFLVDLQEHIQAKLGALQPEIVLDCNRFIRGFLVDNLNIF